MNFISREFIKNTLRASSNLGLFVPQTNKVNEVLVNEEQFQYGSLALLLCHNIYTEWWNSMVTRCENNVFPTQCHSLISSEIAGAILQVRHINDYQFPLGIVSVVCGDMENDTKVINHDIVLPRMLTLQKSTFLLTAWLIPPKAATTWFTKFQRHRRFWWRKFLVHPEHISMSDSKEVNGSQVVSVNIDNDVGTCSIEDISYHGDAPVAACMENQNIPLQIKEGQKFVKPHLITSLTTLDTCMWIYLADSIHVKQQRGKPVTVLRFHPRLAPYSVTVVCFINNAESRERLLELLSSLVKELRKSGLSVFHISTLPTSQENCFNRCDEMGIPYIVVLSDDTLASGIVQLRSRDTALKEEVHLADVKTYMIKLLK